MVENRLSPFRLFNALLMLLLALVMVYPLINLLAISFTGPAAIARANGLTLFPRDATTATYKALLTNQKVYRGLFNSLFITFVGTAINIFLTSIAAYVLTRKYLFGRRLFLVLIIITMIFEGGLIPDYFLVKGLGLIDSYWSVILYKAINPYYLIILMRFFEKVPLSLEESARLEGAGEWQIFSRIILPINKGGLATIGLFYGVFHWNEYFRALIYLNSEAKWPLQVVLRELIVGLDKAAFLGSLSFLKYSDASMMIDIKALKSGMIILAILPVLVLYPFILRYFTKGTMSGSVKE
ncbi:carbohydrate ABC transporter permease [Sediminispirochaeta bajacaliforniensis]|uniref:carbohydrate ABC transporter permease n=1 Tax=Sediminispirochaeta bajacaliforniensis TaxID=148 RepID=UPI0003742C3A|nr:carbohydrate ABC transporter permease [Sediminispirochaeta bajacaliforniensis]